MSRPVKCRRICRMPNITEFKPNTKSSETVILNIEEYEVIRLIDYDNLTQEECARQMNVARPTVTMIYNKARSKIAESIVGCKKLLIKGGNFEICENSGSCCGKCSKHNCSKCVNLKCVKCKN
ncbi:MAG: DUF134 domain-containing protein [Acutalibacteraceae bacterium]